MTEEGSAPHVAVWADEGGCLPAVRRLPVQLYGDERHVVHLPLIPVGARICSLFERIDRLPEDRVVACLEETLASHSMRHLDLPSAFEARYRDAQSLIGWRADWSPARRHLAGAYLTMEYAIEGVALFNPSIVPHPDQTGLPEGAVRFLMSLRATGEGHVSSIVFRTGVIDATGEVRLDPPPVKLAQSRISPDQQYLKHLIRRKLQEMGVSGMAAVESVLAGLKDTFTIPELNQAVVEFRRQESFPPGAHRAIETLMWVARSNYQVRLPPQADLTQLVLYPVMQEEAHGIEDLRLVRFVDDDGTVEYFGTYVAYDGLRILPMLIQTRDFQEIEVHSINGAAALDKDMAMFPRRVNGHYVMCSRIDGENLYIMYSDLVHFWETAACVAGPDAPWNLLQLGNCGSPLETPEGWLLLIHGVGPMRTYSIGAMLLDLDNPLKVRGRLRKPLLSAPPSEREGHVPNVVYTCGAMIHGGTLYMPFALADQYTTMCAIDTSELIQCLLTSGP
ncbi:MAG: glycoside hydrolase family 130 protein [Phycisphaerae bacterium]|nr:glycoside hydrolase family 130 protein [Phycisphaerae bacterium]